MTAASSNTHYFQLHVLLILSYIVNILWLITLTLTGSEDRKIPKTFYILLITLAFVDLDGNAIILSRASLRAESIIDTLEL